MSYSETHTRILLNSFLVLPNFDAEPLHKEPIFTHNKLK